MRTFLLLLLLPACGPYLQYRQDSEKSFVFTSPCGQGPFVVRTELTGARWGERVQVTAYTPRAVLGQVAVTLAQKPLYQGNFASQYQSPDPRGGSRLVVDDKPENVRCLQKPPVVQEIPQKTQPMNAQVLVPGPPREGIQQAREGIQPPRELPPQPPEPPPVAMTGAQLVPQPPGTPVSQTTRTATLTSLTWTSQDDVGTPPMLPGAVLELTFWSQDPNDWEGAVVQLVHEVAQPSVPEAEYTAYLQKQRAEREAEQHKNAEEQRQRDEEWRRQNDARIAHCQADLNDEECWGKGGYPGWLKLQQEHNQQVREQQKQPQKQQPVVVQAPQPHPPEGPPPPAQTDLAPPQPSPHAEWIAGYWQWTGFTWFWLSGWWKVPESDFQVTVTAPIQPPPPPPEMAPPPPLPNAVWLAGAWFWETQTWRWHPGRWTLPPQPGLFWQPPTWIVDPRGVRLRPGMWGLRVL